MNPSQPGAGDAPITNPNPIGAGVQPTVPQTPPTTPPVEPPKPFIPFEEEPKTGDQPPVAPPTKKEDDDDGEGGDEKFIDQRVAEQTRPLAEKIERQEVRERVDEFLTDPKNEVYKDFAKQIREYAIHPKAKGLTIEAIARMAVDPRELLQKGAELERKVYEKSRASYTGGGQPKAPIDTGKLPNAWDLTPEQYEAEKAKLLNPNQ